MKKTIYILLLMFVGLQTFSQSTDDKAKAAYLKASEEFDNGSYQSCINKLEEAKSLLGKSNARIQYLLSKSYWQLQNYTQTKAELQKYFNYNPKVDNWYKEMTELTENVDKKLLDEKAFNEARDVNTKESFQKYLDRFPNGNYTKQVKNSLEKYIWAEVTNTNTIESYKRYINEYPDGLHIGEANKFVSNYEKEADLRNNPNKYFADAITNKDYNLILKLCEYGADPNIKSGCESAMSIGANLRYELALPYFRKLLKYDIRGKGNAIDGCEEDMVATKFIEYINFGYEHIVTDEQIIEAIKFFVQNGWNINSGKTTVLIYLSENYVSNTKQSRKSLTVIKYLLDIGADPFREEQGSTRFERLSAYDWAKMRDNKDLKDLFKKYKK